MLRPWGYDWEWAWNSRQKNGNIGLKCFSGAPNQLLYRCHAKYERNALALASEGRTTRMTVTTTQLAHM